MTQIINRVTDKQKLYLIRPGRYHVFGKDFEERDNMNDSEAIKRFDETWENKIKNEILNADLIDYDDAVQLINRKSANYCQRSQEHRKFKVEGNLFVAQLDKKNSYYEHNQLWTIDGRNNDTRTLFVTFKTQQDRDDWERLAQRFGSEDEQLGLKALMSFLKAFSE